MNFQCELWQAINGHMYTTYDWLDEKDAKFGKEVPVENLRGKWAVSHVYDLIGISIG